MHILASNLMYLKLKICVVYTEYSAFKYVFVDFAVPNFMIIGNCISKIFIYLFLVEIKDLSRVCVLSIHHGNFN